MTIQNYEQQIPNKLNSQIIFSPKGDIKCYYNFMQVSSKSCCGDVLGRKNSCSGQSGNQGWSGATKRP